MSALSLVDGAPALRGLSDALRAGEPIYLLPKDDVANDVISPALSSCNSADVMIGFFASQSLAEIAPGLATYLRSTKVRQWTPGVQLDGEVSSKCAPGPARH